MAKLELLDFELKVGDQWLFRDSSPTFMPGQVWGILGPNGIGKSTFLQILMGFLKPTAGQVILDGQAVSTIKPKERAKKIGMLLQDYEFPFPSNVLDTVLIGRYPYQSSWFGTYHKEDQSIAMAALKQMGLEDLKGRSVFHLSGGEKRRLMVATLLAQNPEIFLLDEPTNHLDFQQQFRLLSFFKQLAHQKGKVVIMVLHDLQLLERFCDYVITLGYGHDNVCGSHQEVMNYLYLSGCFNDNDISKGKVILQ